MQGCCAAARSARTAATDRTGCGCSTASRFTGSTSEFRDNRRVIVPFEKLYEAASALKSEFGFDMLAAVAIWSMVAW